jgi:hypothetical protein
MSLLEGDTEWGRREGAVSIPAWNFLPESENPVIQAWWTGEAEG